MYKFPSINNLSYSEGFKKKQLSGLYTVSARDVLESEEYKSQDYEIPVIVGVDDEFRPVVRDLVNVSHVFAGGHLGAGQLNFLIDFISTFALTVSPKNVGLVLLDPIRAELSCAQQLPHCILPFADQLTGIKAALFWLWREMQRRYAIFTAVGVDNINEYEGDDIPRIVVCACYIDRAFRTGYELFADDFNALIKHGAKAGIHFVVTAQDPANEEYWGDLIKYFGLTLALKHKQNDGNKLWLPSFSYYETNYDMWGVGYLHVRGEKELQRVHITCEPTDCEGISKLVSECASINEKYTVSENKLKEFEILRQEAEKEVAEYSQNNEAIQNGKKLYRKSKS